MATDKSRIATLANDSSRVRRQRSTAASHASGSVRECERLITFARRACPHVFAAYIHAFRERADIARKAATGRVARARARRAVRQSAPLSSWRSRAAMVAATLAIMEEGWAGGSVGARRRQTGGGSAGAPFRHFASRKALLTAVAEEATEALRRDVAGAVAASREAAPDLRLNAVAAAYLKWALANPARFEAISDRRMIDYEGSPTLRARNDETRALLDGEIAAVLAAAGRPSSRRKCGISASRCGRSAMAWRAWSSTDISPTGRSPAKTRPSRDRTYRRQVCRPAGVRRLPRDPPFRFVAAKYD